MIKTTTISNCGKYRYCLHRGWDESRPFVMFVMLNPSTADAEQDDPTIRRLIGFCTLRGFGGFSVCNVYAYRDSSPESMFKANKAGIDIAGPDNVKWLNDVVQECEIVVMAWGNDGPNSDVFTAWADKRNKPLFSFGRTQTGKPKHPLYLPADNAFYVENSIALTYKFPVIGKPPELF